MEAEQDEARSLADFAGFYVDVRGRAHRTERGPKSAGSGPVSGVGAEGTFHRGAGPTESVRGQRSDGKQFRQKSRTGAER